MKESPIQTHAVLQSLLIQRSATFGQTPTFKLQIYREPEIARNGSSCLIVTPLSFLSIAFSPVA